MSRLNIRKWTWDGNKLVLPHLMLWRLVWAPVLYGLALLLCLTITLTYFSIKEGRDTWRNIV